MQLETRNVFTDILNTFQTFTEETDDQGGDIQEKNKISEVIVFNKLTWKIFLTNIFVFSDTNNIKYQ